MLRLLVLCCAFSACYQTPGADPGADGPGSEAWGSTQVTCAKTSDCNSSEECVEGVCQLRMCTNGPYTSAPPIGNSFVFAHDRELVTGSGSEISGFEPSSLAAMGSWNVAMGSISDMAAGNIVGERPEEIVVSTAGSRSVSIARDDGTVTTFELGFVPVAVAAGDFDLDGVDELVALGATALEVCRVEAETCERLLLEGGEGVNVAVADVDGDSLAEIIVLKTSNVLLVLNPDASTTLQQERYTAATEVTLSRIAAGDLNGDGTAEILGVEEDDCTVLCDDDLLHVYHVNNEGASHDGAWDINSRDILDISIGDTDGDQFAEVFLLRDGGIVRSLEMVGKAQFATIANKDLGNAAEYLAVADTDGDSPIASLVSGPELVSGRPVPLFAAFYPPYWREHSATPANVYVGNSDLETRSRVETISLSTGYEVGIDFDLGPVFEAGLSAQLTNRSWAAQSRTSVQFVGNRLWTQAQPDLYGPHYGSVMVANTCYHAYTYEMDDPAGTTAGGDKERFSILAPVDGKTSVLSTMRFNALAKALGGLPVIEVPHTIGDPRTYPDRVQTLEGDPVPPEDLLAPNAPSYSASEVGFVGFWLALWEYVGEEQATGTNVSVSVSGGVAGFDGRVNRGSEIYRSHRLEIGRETVFGGMLPTLSDDPTTPEDEYAENLYSFSPIVYRDHYLDAGGGEAAFFVFHYMVGN